MDELVQRAGEKGVQEIVIGMAHRGRLNVLVNTLGKMPKDLFAEFDHTAPERPAVGRRQVPPGLLERHHDPRRPGAPEPGVQPLAPRDRQPGRRRSASRRAWIAAATRKATRCCRCIVHGDAAFAGQGVVMETLALAQTRGYYTGGTVHVVINNQIGFTTSDPRDSRSTLYCTDVVKMIEAPVLHVNGDDPEAVVLRHAAGARLPAGVQQGRRRRHRLLPQARPQRAGHAGADPAADVQEDRAAIPARASCTARSWWRRASLPADGPDEMVKAFRAAMDAGKHTDDPVLTNFKSKYAVDWAPFLGTQVDRCGRHGAAAGRDQAPGRAHHDDPAGLQGAPAGREGASPTAPRWAAARSMSTGAWASTSRSRRWWRAATAVRLSGEDCGRGTFTHRHAVLHDQNREKWDEGTYTPLQHVAEDQAPFVVIDSHPVRRGGARLRVRLCERRAEHAGDLGSAVRRLRQRRAGRHRPVHRLRRGQVGPRQRPHADAAARLRRARGPSTRRRGSSDSCSWRPTTTCRSCSRPRPARSSTCCAGRWCACSASRWSS